MTQLTELGFHRTSKATYHLIRWKDGTGSAIGPLPHPGQLGARGPVFTIPLPVEQMEEAKALLIREIEKRGL